MTKKIVIATIGSLGDLHPFVAIGAALQELGANVVMAVPSSHLSKVEGAGLKAHPIMPDFSAVQNELGMSEAEAAQRVMTDPDFLIRQIILNSLPATTRALDHIAAGADMMVGSLFALSADIVSQKRGIPFAVCLLQPLAFQSALDPPRTPDFRMMFKYPARGLARSWNMVWRDLIAREMKRRYAVPINAVRLEHGLPRLKNAPVFDIESEGALRLALFSSLLAPDDPAVVAGAHFTGFPIFDSHTGQREPLDREVDEFLATGTPPIVFTLGSFAVFAPGSFYQRSAEACRSLGRRAIFLTGKPGEAQTTETVLTRAYLPHSQVFPQCAAIVHHGGIGTTGQAMMSGRTQVVVPHMGDQWDNGHRLERLGIARVLPASEYSSDRARDVLDDLLSCEATACRAENVACQVNTENGAAEAAKLILSTFR
ncbi:MAG: glycosyltransferase [Hyphomonadaceae bacterium]|nr:MAG: hypothetical protein FD160_381 [Caulobacteraceae bacterium]MBT9445761.1 glycosyltransferase [Hyphomonadaceae bacterium]TPW02747.1 MAG: hypothetical protein FD124_3276 [Alphaproteobacteria bacterium]